MADTVSRRGRGWLRALSWIPPPGRHRKNQRARAGPGSTALTVAAAALGGLGGGSVPDCEVAAMVCRLLEETLEGAVPSTEAVA